MGTDLRSPRHLRLTPADRGTRRRRIAATALALLAALLVGHIVARAEGARNRWGATTDVLVVTEAVPAGAELDRLVEIRSWPTALVPDDRVRSPDDLDGARATVALTPGTPLTSSLVSAGPEQRREHVAVRTEAGSLPLRPGDSVSVWATFDPSLSPDEATTRRIAQGVIVVSSDDDRTVIALHPDDTAGVVEALVRSTVTLVSEPR